ncbi:esterase-like activity of phytase family protein [Pelagibacterium sp. 26DY04]|uniref:esterase-like activity of phytase family protein n=1 Tax=Pelagibacterium sp. 26DY04 TaxID=2967130 RepID=UPI002815237B|nr:esterase-like activity of phytase family protein [Pelagibacterium sp. 26DY04]WMT86614.1 esterase-like activity of phytase family protein [Pelagibacterium sp. 26DY04]
MRSPLSFLALTSLLLPASALAQSPSAEPITVTASPITDFQRAAIGEQVDGLIFKGGLQLSSSHPDFGGISGLAFLDADRFVMVTDEGRFISGALALAEGAPAGVADVEIDVIRNSKGAPLPRKFAQDSEAVEAIFREDGTSAVRVGFEHLARIADFEMIAGRPGGAAREVAIPDWLTALRTNESIESVCIAPPASPVAGSTLIITEAHSLVPGTWAATLLGNRDRGDLHLAQGGGVNPTDCAFLPNGDLLVLERGFAFLTFTARLRLIPADEVQPGATMEGEVIFSASGGEIDNFEALGVRGLPDGETRITMVSDDNFNSFQRTLLLDFALPDPE